MLDYSREILRQFTWDINHHLAIFPRNSKHKLLVVQEEGLGNAVLTTPLIEALSTLSPSFTIEVMVNRSKSTDLVFGKWELVNKVWDRHEIISTKRNHYFHYVIECHPRHDLPKNIKYLHRQRIAIRPKNRIEYHWLFLKHEAEYLLDMARKLGYEGPRPRLRNLPGDPHYSFNFSNDMVAIGIGYFKGLRPDGRDGSDRHWGNNNFMELCNRLKELGLRPVLVGDHKDLEKDGQGLIDRGVASVCGKLTLPQIIDFFSRCQAFIGNDTGLMHVAAAATIPVIGIFVNTNSIKSYPLGDHCFALGGDNGPQRYSIPVDLVYQTFVKLMNSK